MHAVQGLFSYCFQQNCHFKTFIYYRNNLLINTQQYNDMSMHQYLICSTAIHIETLCITMHWSVTVLSHLYNIYNIIIYITILSWYIISSIWTFLPFKALCKNGWAVIAWRIFAKKVVLTIDNIFMTSWEITFGKKLFTI